MITSFHGIFNHPKEECKHPVIHYIAEILCLFIIGAIVYPLIEILYRGYSHWTMALVGAIAFLLVGALNNCVFGYTIGVIPQMVIGGCLITLVEFVAGVIINIWFGLGVWDYSNLPFNVLGQVCLPFTFIWMVLSLLAIVVDDYIRYKLFGERKPHYHLWKCPGFTCTKDPNREIHVHSDID